MYSLKDEYITRGDFVPISLTLGPVGSNLQTNFQMFNTLLLHYLPLNTVVPV